MKLKTFMNLVTLMKPKNSYIYSSNNAYYYSVNFGSLCKIMIFFS